MNSLQHLPSELTITIANFLEEADLNSLCQVNRSFYNLLNTQLYRLNARNSSSALMWAANKGNESTARMSLQGGASASGTDEHGHTPLAYAVAWGHVGVVRILLGVGRIDVNSKCPDNRTPLIHAVQRGQTTYADGEKPKG